MKASEAGDIHSFIICPSAIYGMGSGPDKRDSLFFRMMVSEIARRREAYYIGEGSNKIGFVSPSFCISETRLLVRSELRYISKTSSISARKFSNSPLTL